MSVQVRTSTHKSGDHRQHVYAETTQLGMQSLRESHGSELGGAVGKQVRHADSAADGSDVDDVSAAALDHSGNHGKREMDHAPEDDVHGFVEVVERVRFKRSDGGGPRVVDQNVDAAEVAAGDGNQVVHLLGLAYITGYGADFGAQPLHSLARAGEFA